MADGLTIMAHGWNKFSKKENKIKGKEYETLNLTDYLIGSYGQNLPGDKLETVIKS